MKPDANVSALLFTFTVQKYAHDQSRYMNEHFEILKLLVILDVYRKQGEQTGVPEENPRQPVRKSVSHIRGENSPPNPRPLTLVIIKFAWSESAGSIPLNYWLSMADPSQWPVTDPTYKFEIKINGVF